MGPSKESKVEVRGFSFIKELFDQRGLPFPLLVDLTGECTAEELAQRLEIPPDYVEAVFINGMVSSPGQRISPGDRVAFVPPGTPGPYRVILGLVKHAGQNGK